MTNWRKSLAGYGPTMARPSGAEAVRAALGAALGLGVAALVLWLLPGHGARALLDQPLLIAPFGATAYLIFAVPNSPLAQPWAAVVGNGLAAVVALIVMQLGLPVLAAVLLAVAAAVLALSAARALHPPAGAVALLLVLQGATDPWTVLNPVVAGTVALVLVGVIWNTATGRTYPMRPL